MPTEREPTFEEVLAWSMDADPALFPYLPALLQDVEELGARVDEVLRVLANVTISSEARVLDLGCGKGAVALALAGKFGCSVHAVDGMAAFIRHAEDRAASMGLTDNCVFAEADLCDAVQQSHGYDLVCLNALGGVLGRLDETVGMLRECVVPGGLILVDDAYLKAGVEPSEDLAHCYSRDVTLELLTAHGDEILAELVVDGPESMDHYQQMMKSIVRRAEELAAQHPESADLLLEFAMRQAADVAMLDGPVEGALWLLKKAQP